MVRKETTNIVIKQIYQEWKERRKARIESHLKNWKRSINYSKRWTRWINEAEEGQGGGEAPGRSPSLDAQGADTLVTRVSGCSSLRPLQGGGNMGQGISPL